MREVVNYVAQYDLYILIGLIVLNLFLVITIVSVLSKIKRLHKRKNAKIEEGGIAEIADAINKLSHSSEVLEGHMRDIMFRQDEQLKILQKCVQNVGMVRFNAFDDIGGEQSFALALLDSHRNGIVISSLHGRQDSRVYAKQISGGEGERPLSGEEQKAIEAAFDSGTQRVRG